MATRTLEQFRAEYKIWRKDLAKELELTEEALERLETIGEVPEDIKVKLTENYGLPEDYFTVDIDAVRAQEAAAMRKDPKKPLAYFFVTSLVWSLLVTLVQYAVRLPMAVSNSLGYAAAPAFSYIETVCVTIITIFSGIYLGAYLLKRSNFRGNIADFEFLYPYLSYIAVSWVSALTIIFTNPLVPADVSFDVFNISAAATSLIGSCFSLLLQALFLTFLLDTAACAEGAEKSKRLKILCAVTLGLQIFTYILGMISGNYFTADALTWINRVLSFLLLLAVLYGILFGAKQLPKLKMLWYTILPITAMALPTVFSLIEQLITD